MSIKQKISSAHTEYKVYELPIVGSFRSRKTERFKPSEQNFSTLLDDAFKSRLSQLINANMKQAIRRSKKDMKSTELKRLKVPPRTFEELDNLYGGYRMANTYL